MHDSLILRREMTILWPSFIPRCACHLSSCIVSYFFISWLWKYFRRGLAVASISAKSTCQWDYARWKICSAPARKMKDVHVSSQAVRLGRSFPSCLCLLSDQNDGWMQFSCLTLFCFPDGLTSTARNKEDISKVKTQSEKKTQSQVNFIDFLNNTVLHLKPFIY